MVIGAWSQPTGAALRVEPTVRPGLDTPLRGYARQNNRGAPDSMPFIPS